MLENASEITVMMMDVNLLLLGGVFTELLNQNIGF